MLPFVRVKTQVEALVDRITVTFNPRVQGSIPGRPAPQAPLRPHLSRGGEEPVYAISGWPLRPAPSPEVRPAGASPGSNVVPSRFTCAKRQSPLMERS